MRSAMTDLGRKPKSAPVGFALPIADSSIWTRPSRTSVAAAPYARLLDGLECLSVLGEPSEPTSVGFRSSPDSS